MSKPRPIISEMPRNLKQLIVDSADTKTKIALRPVSNEFNGLVSRSQISYFQLLFKLGTDKRTATVMFAPFPGKTMQLMFIHKDNGYEIKELGSTRKLVINANFLEGAVNQFVKVLKNPKVLIKQFELAFPGFHPGWGAVLKNKVLDRLKAFFASLAHPIRVRKLQLHCDTQHDILKVLPFLQSGTLEIISLEKPRSDGIECDLSEIAETEQWKSAKDLYMEGLEPLLQVEKWSHFRKTEVDIPELTVSRVKSIFNSFINSTQWKRCTITSFSLDERQFVNYFKQLGTHEVDKGQEHTFTISHPSRTVIVRIMTCWVKFWQT